MHFENVRRIGLAAVALVASCAAPRFALREPLLKDDDRRPFANIPEEYYSPFAWDGADQMVFRPLARVFAVDPAGPAHNVNALDEVPDSSWFENRLGVRPLSAVEVARGACSDKVLDPNMPDGSWVVDKGKDDGANPGFRVNIPGVGKFMLKADPSTEPDRATGATAIASRIYYAVGYHSVCDTVVYFRPSLLTLKPGLTVTNNEGVTRALDRALLDRTLANASKRDGLIRMVASSWLDGKPIGPFRYEGTRDDDPNDVIDHQERRELRGGRLLAAWLNHFDSREQNTLDLFVPLNPEHKGGPGFVRHHMIDFGDCFGSVWADDGISRRLGHASIFDLNYVAEDFVTLGTVERPWERAERTGGVFNYFSARDFDPELWRGEYPNPAFLRMIEADGAWMARILAHFDDSLVQAAVEVGKYDKDSERYLVETLIQRRDAILRRYLSRLSPLSKVTVTRDRVCALDLARKARVVPNERVTFRALAYRGVDSVPDNKVRLLDVEPPSVCVALSHGAFPSGLADDAAERYVVLDIRNGYAPGPLRAHLYDLGPKRGFRLAGVERPESASAP